MKRECDQILLHAEDLDAEAEEELRQYSLGQMKGATLSRLFVSLSGLCEKSAKNIVMLIDEVDSAVDNQIFMDFLAQLRFYYLRRRKISTFHSVILAGVYDICNVRQKIRPDEEYKQNSPWNIAADFDVDMNFSAADIAGMLQQYENEHRTGMNVREISALLYEYTSGYPFLAARLCKLMDEKIAGIYIAEDKPEAWTKNTVSEAVKMLVSEKNTLFRSLIGKLNEYPSLKEMIYQLLFRGQSIMYNADDKAMDMLLMFGFVKIVKETVQIANRIFEMRLYNYFLTLPENQRGDMYKLALRDKNQFIRVIRR